MKKLKIIEQDIHFLLGRRNGFGTNGSPGERRKSDRVRNPNNKSVDRDPSFNGLCVARKDGEDWWIGKVLHSDIDEETPTLNVYRPVSHKKSLTQRLREVNRDINLIK